MCQPNLTPQPPRYKFVANDRLGLTTPLVERYNHRTVVTVIVVAASLSRFEWLFQTISQEVGSFYLCLCLCAAYGCVVLQRWQRKVGMVRKASTEAFRKVASGEALVGRIRTTSPRNLIVTDALSQSQCFCDLQHIQELRLSDLGAIFQSITKDFDQNCENCEPRQQIVLEAIAHATSHCKYSSRRDQPWDTLKFAAGIRIFAEWRLLRLVPPGHASYAIGMGLSRRDLIANVKKLEVAAHAYAARHGFVPTIPELLVDEIAQQKHIDLPRLEDQSGANGLLWIQRQLQFQATLFEKTTHSDSADDAAVSAYKSVYQEYHGFWVRKVFARSFQASPNTQVILDYMLTPSKRTRRQTVPSSSSLSTMETKDIPRREQGQQPMSSTLIPNCTSLQTQPPCPSMQNHPAAPSKPSPNLVDHIVSHTVHEWNKFHQFVNQCGGASVPNKGSAFCKVEDTIKPQRLEAVFEIDVFLEQVQPCVDQLRAWITLHNMNDPTKV